jgi:hypothetical protein
MASQKLRQLAHKPRGVDVMLTRGLRWPELLCRVHVDDGRAEEVWRRSRKGCSRGARGPLVARIGLGSPCGGDQGVKAARDLPAARKLRRRYSSPAAAPSRILDDAEARGTNAGLGKLPGDAAERTQGLSGSGLQRNDGSTVTQRGWRGGANGRRR